MNTSLSLKEPVWVPPDFVLTGQRWLCLQGFGSGLAGDSKHKRQMKRHVNNNDVAMIIQTKIWFPPLNTVVNSGLFMVLWLLIPKQPTPHSSGFIVSAATCEPGRWAGAKPVGRLHQSLISKCRLYCSPAQLPDRRHKHTTALNIGNPPGL